MLPTLATVGAQKTPSFRAHGGFVGMPSMRELNHCESEYAVVRFVTTWMGMRFWAVLDP